MPVRGRLGALGMHLDRQPSSESAKRTICRTLGSEPVRTIWDYVYRRFGITKSENTRNTMGLKLPQLSDLISLDACRSKIMFHPAGNQVTSLFKMVHREFHTLRRIYRLLIWAPLTHFGTTFPNLWQICSPIATFGLPDL